MTRYVFKMPDLGEGTVEAEVVAWHVQVGDTVAEDQILAEVMTDKAAVEVPSPVSGRVAAINGQPGDMVRVGSEFVVFETEVSDASLTSVGEVARSADEGPQPAPQPAPAVAAEGVRQVRVGEVLRNPIEPSGRVKASPATRRRAREAGLDLRSVHGSGPSGRITRQDVEAAVRAPASTLRRAVRPRLPASPRAPACWRSRSSACGASSHSG